MSAQSFNVSTIWNQLWKWHYQLLSLLSLQTFSEGKQGSSSSPVKSDPQSSHDLGNDDEPPTYSKRQKVGLILGPVLFLSLFFFFTPEGLSYEARAVLASTVWIATWWVTEAIPIPVTSLLPIILFPSLNALESSIVVSSYGDNNIFLFMGGFVLALALEKWNVHKRIAITIIHFIGTSTSRIVLGFILATGFLSMWISNTATAMMMVPIGTAIVYQISQSLKEQNVPNYEVERKKFARSILLAIAYSASIGGLGTIIGTPPNTLFVGAVDNIYGIQISFVQWMMFGVPLSLLMLAILWVYLVRFQFKMEIRDVPGGQVAIDAERKALGRINPEEIIVLCVFVLTAFFWMTRTFLFENIIPNDTTIAISAAVLLFILPAVRSSGRIMDWDTAKKLPWGILLLFGGGLAIADGFTETGLAEWIGQQLTILEGINLLLIIVAVTALVIFLTEITSNTATATMMFPIMASLAMAIDVHPYALMVAAGLAASCAFMLPVATPPNAVVFSSSELRIGDMIRAGFALNIISIGLITLFVYLWLPTVWGIDITIYPF